MTKSKFKLLVGFITLLSFLLFSLPGCSGTGYTRVDRAIAEDFAELYLRLRYALPFSVENTTFDSEAGVFRIQAASWDGQYERQINLRVEAGRVFVVR